MGWAALYYCFLQGQAAAAFWVHRVRREEANATSKSSGASQPRTFAVIEFASVKYGADSATGGLRFVMYRSVGNLLEQSPPFLVSLWLHAFTDSPDDAAWFGWLWLLLRASYPIVFAHPSMAPAMWDAQRRLGISWVNFVTWPSYAVIWKMLISSAKASW